MQLCRLQEKRTKFKQEILGLEGLDFTGILI